MRRRTAACAACCPCFASAAGGRRCSRRRGGLLADDEAVAAALLAPAREEVARERLAWLELRDQPRAWPDLETNREHLTMVLELTREPEGQWARFGAKLRNQIRKGEKAGYERRWGHANLAAFHRVMLENMRDLGTRFAARPTTGWRSSCSARRPTCW